MKTIVIGEDGGLLDNYLEKIWRICLGSLLYLIESTVVKVTKKSVKDYGKS